MFSLSFISANSISDAAKSRVDVKMSKPGIEVFFMALLSNFCLVKSSYKDGFLCSSLIPKEDENFLDSVHFTPKGMRLLAEKISEVININ